ncbi:uracil-DNA glycosylase family protein [Sphingomonas sp. 3-13AW]|uniref:uracil-DNA glycosylase family protein n=1 Tax=Sphingomonas sp. 3-13AW TaxID=3050450 RepID=UPI003BB567FF
MQFHLSERIPVAAAIAASARARSVPQLCAALRAFDAHPAAVECVAALPKRTRTVNPLMILAERPEPEDLVTGHPFSGPNGQPMLRAMKMAGLQLSDFHISHAVHWTPFDGKTPNATLVSTSRPFLFREIALVKPRAILALGRIAIDALIGLREPITPYVGTTMTWTQGRLNIPVQLSWNPAYCLHVSTAQADLERGLTDFVTRFGETRYFREAA